MKYIVGAREQKKRNIPMRIRLAPASIPVQRAVRMSGMLEAQFRESFGVAVLHNSSSVMDLLEGEKGEGLKLLFDCKNVLTSQKLG